MMPNSLSFRPKEEIFLQCTLGKVHRLAGDELNTLIEQLNESLAA